MPRYVPAPSSAARRKAKVAENVRHFYARADYVTPRVALDATHTKALRGYMKREGLGVSDAIRAAIIAAAKPRTTPKRQPKARS
jgi:hypothetical protein